MSTTGNPDGHLVLRGGNRGTNYHLEAVQDAAAELAGAGLSDRLMVDCSHGNSNKDFQRQGEVLQSVADQVREGSSNLMGVMIESHLVREIRSSPVICQSSLTARASRMPASASRPPSSCLVVLQRLWRLAAQR